MADLEPGLTCSDCGKRVALTIHGRCGACDDIACAVRPTPSLSPRGEATPRADALSRYLAYFGPICNHHRDDCPDDCEGQLAWQAQADLTALLAEAQAAREKAIEECAKECDRMAVCYGDDVNLANARRDGHSATSSSGAMYAAEIIARRIRALAATDRAR